MTRERPDANPTQLFGPRSTVATRRASQCRGPATGASQTATNHGYGANSAADGAPRSSGGRGPNPTGGQ